MNQKNIEQRVEKLEQRVEKLENATLGEVDSTSVVGRKRKKTSIKEFLLLKKADNDVKRTLLIAYFFEKFEDFSSFNSEDLKNGFLKAKIKRPLNINDKININIRNGHMMEIQEKKDSKKTWVLTSTGEIYVENNF